MNAESMDSVLPGIMASGAGRHSHARSYTRAFVLFVFLGIYVISAALSRGSSSSWHRWHHPTSKLEQLHATPVYQLLQAAKDKVEAGQGLNQSQPGLFSQSGCTVASQQLQGVLAAAAAFETEARTQDGLLSRKTAHTVATKLRQQFSREWAAVLAPFSQASGPSNRTCRSVRLAPPSDTPSGSQTISQDNTSKPSTALLLVLGDWSQLGRMLRLYSLNLFTIWSYARTQGYGLELYVHGQPLPNDMPVFFIKVLGVHHLFHTLGYQHVLYLDLDSFTSTHSSPPLSLFYGEFPAASLLLQAEHNVCAAAMLWRNTPEAAVLLQAWWDVGASGCCPNFPHDQTALKHMVLVYMANVTSQPWLYGPDMQHRFRLPPKSDGAVHAPTDSIASDADIHKQHTRATAQHTSPTDAAPAAAAAAAPAAAAAAQQTSQKLSEDRWPHRVSALLALRPRLEQTQSDVGFVGLDVHYEAMKGSSQRRTVLHNCLGQWRGCVPFDTPSLLYHTGHWIMEDLSEPWLAQRLLHTVKDWSSTLASHRPSLLAAPHSTEASSAVIASPAHPAKPG